MEKNITFDPVDITLFCTNAVVLATDDIPDLIEQSRLLFAFFVSP
ncbi:MAG: hypothetical protein PHY78_08630 [Desulfobacterales bacterium]|nr:hypothetical protein [Desulfobacterales bacterium]MDD4393794.1 hypothetical protein [Desulfobacterales bacterium]